MTIHDQEFHSDIKYRPHNSETFVMAIESTLKNWAFGARTLFSQWRQHHIDRQAFSHLLSLDNHVLDDIGITRDDVVWAAQLPINVNASLKLEKIARTDRTIRK